jgi:hypothetical protein
LKNDVGKTDATISVDVLTKPKVNEQPEFQVSIKQNRLIKLFQYVHAGAPLALHCPIASNLPVEISWQWNGRELNNKTLPGLTLSEDKRRLMLTQMRVSDAGSFICTVRNAAGEASKTFVINVDGIDLN